MLMPPASQWKIRWLGRSVAFTAPHWEHVLELG
jgi:hypothetical protein